MLLIQCGNPDGVEVKAGATVVRDDFKGLARLRDIEPSSFIAGIVAYDGSAIVPFGEKLFAVPIAHVVGM